MSEKRILGETIAFRLRWAERERLEQLAAMEEVTLSKTVRRLVLTALAAEEKERRLAKYEG